MTNNDKRCNGMSWDDAYTYRCGNDGIHHAFDQWWCNECYTYKRSCIIGYIAERTGRKVAPDCADVELDKALNELAGGAV